MNFRGRNIQGLIKPSKALYMFDNIFKSHGQMSEKDLLLTVIQNQHIIMGQNALEFHFLKSKIDNLMTKAEFIQGITDLKTEVVGIGTKVDALETAINNAGDVIPQEVVDAFADLKSGVDSLNTKADNTPVVVPTV